MEFINNLLYYVLIAFLLIFLFFVFIIFLLILFTPFGLDFKFIHKKNKTDKDIYCEENHVNYDNK